MQTTRTTARPKCLRLSEAAHRLSCDPFARPSRTRLVRQGGLTLSCPSLLRRGLVMAAMLPSSILVTCCQESKVGKKGLF